MHWYVSWPAAVTLGLAIAALVMERRSSHPRRWSWAALTCVGLWVLAVFGPAWFHYVRAPEPYIGMALPWSNPPAVIEYNDIPYGRGHYSTATDWREEPCRARNDLERRAGFSGMEPVGGIVGILGGPTVWSEGQGDELLIEVRNGCFQRYPQWT